MSHAIKEMVTKIKTGFLPTLSEKLPKIAVPVQTSATLHYEPYF